MSKFKYKNISGHDQALIGFGLVKAGATVVVNYQINNPNFELQFDGDDRVGIEAPPDKPKKTGRRGHK
jgi:hypothetical protein